MAAHVTGSRGRAAPALAGVAARGRNIGPWSRCSSPTCTSTPRARHRAAVPRIPRRRGALRRRALHPRRPVRGLARRRRPGPRGPGDGQALRALTDAGVPCFVMHGNRDFLIGERFCRETGATLLDDGTVVDLHGERVLLMHGDVLCTDDASYQRLRRIVRNPVVQLDPAPPDARTATRPRAQTARGQPRAHRHDRARDHGRECRPRSAQAFRAAGVRTLIHGHTHRPAVHELVVDGASGTAHRARRLVHAGQRARVVARVGRAAVAAALRLIGSPSTGQSAVRIVIGRDAVNPSMRLARDVRVARRPANHDRTAESLLAWVRRTTRDPGTSDGTTTSPRAKL